MKINPNRTSTTEQTMECYYCKETKSPKEFCDEPELNGKFACLSCDENMRNCDGCEDCPDTFYKDLYHIDGEYYCKECYKEREEKDGPICSICEEEYTGFGNNAQPVNDGQCCDKCNFRTVLPARMMAKPIRKIKVKKPKPTHKVLEVITHTPSTIYKIPADWAIEDISVYWGSIYYKGNFVSLPEQEIEGEKDCPEISIGDYNVDEYFDCE